jgi:hypothetical protein
MRLDSHRITTVVTGIILAVYLGMPIQAFAQESARPQRHDRGSLQLHETEITGILKNGLGSLNLSETEVIGTLERPRLNYSLPWKDPASFTVVCNFKGGCLPPSTDPDLLLQEGGEAQETFPEELYIPLDKETFSREIRSAGIVSVP